MDSTLAPFPTLKRRTPGRRRGKPETTLGRWVGGWRRRKPRRPLLGAATFGFRLLKFAAIPLPQISSTLAQLCSHLRDGLGKIRRDMKFEDGKAFHAFRRFRTAHLRKNRMPWDLQKLWLGHANKDVTDRYAEQLKEDVEWRKQEAERAGLGFKLPTIESSVGLLGLPKQQKSQLKKVA